MIRAAFLCIFAAACGASGPPPESPPSPPLPTEPIAGPAPSPEPPPTQEAFEDKPVPLAPVPTSAPCVVPSALRVIASGTRDSIVDAVSLDGGSLSTRIVSGKTVTVAVYATAAYGVLSFAQLDPRALAWSFDGKRQAVVDGSRILLQADGATEIIAGAVAPASPPSPSVAGAEQASMSHDGRFLVLQSAPVVYDLAQKARTALPAPPIAGGREVVYRIDATGHFLFAENSRVAFVGALLRAGTKVTVTWEATSHGALRTPDGATWLEVPRAPFAQDWVPTFSLETAARGAIGGRSKALLPLRLGPKEPYAAALCPGGNVVAVLAQGSLGFYATDTGKLLLKKGAKELGLPPMATSLLFVDAGRGLIVRAPPKEISLGLAAP